MIKYYHSEFTFFFYFSSAVHLFALFFLVLNDFVNFSSGTIDMNISERPIAVRLGQVRNTRMKERDSRYEKNYKIIQKSDQSKALEQKHVLEKSSKDLAKADIVGKSEQQKEVSPKSPNKKNQLELKKKKNNAVRELAKSYSAENVHASADVQQKRKKSLKTASSFFDPLEDISDCSSFEECKSISDIHKLQFKNDVIEFIRSNWNVPDCLLDKDLKVSVLITFNRAGFITHYEIKNHPNTKDYRTLVESIKPVLFLMTKKPLPVNGRKLNSNSILFTFAPMYN